MGTAAVLGRPSAPPWVPTVLLIDDHPVFRAGLVSVLSWPGCRWQVKEAASVAEAEALLAEHLPVDMVLYDWHMPALGGCRGLRRIRERAGAAQLVVISADDDDAIALAARQCGAADVLSKSHSGDVIRRHLAALLADRLPARPAPDEEPAGHAEAPREADAAPYPLSDRQREVLGLLALGCANKRIASMLAIAEATVRAHVSEIFRILKVHNRTQAALMAARLGLARPPEPSGRPLH